MINNKINTQIKNLKQTMKINIIKKFSKIPAKSLAFATIILLLADAACVKMLYETNLSALRSELKTKSDCMRAFSGSNFLLPAEDISSTTITDKNGKIVFERINPEITTPLTVFAPVKTKTFEGTLKISAQKPGIAPYTAKTLPTFLLLWIVAVTGILVNDFQKKKELKIFHDALKCVSAGNFGIKINEKSFKNPETAELFNNFSQNLKLYEDENINRITFEKNRFESIISNIANGIAVCDNSDNVILLNPPAKKILGTDADGNFVLTKFKDKNQNESFSQIEQFKDLPLEEILKKPPVYKTEINDKIISYTVTPLILQNGDYAGYIAVLTDITEQEEINRMKNTFISNVSHELRTPVTVLRTYLDTLATVELDDATRNEFIQTSNNEVIRLHKMVNDILDTSRLESAEHKSEKTDENLVSLVNNTVESLKILGKDKNITFEQKADADEICVNCCKTEIERVLNNLISNALKYSPENGQITVKTALDGEFADVSVTDEGPGIPENALEKVFDRFYRVENSVHTVKGTGIGLYLVKLTIEKYHGGKVYVKSKLGEGSTFGFKIPVKKEV